jgi:hypothetical protein
MERLFVDYPGQLQPKSEYLRLFTEIVIDVWKEKRGVAAAIHETAMHDLNDIRERASHQQSDLSRANGPSE